ncbi:hypothetical protein GCM10009839_25070 [Catenulispora yoronensis]|uniref:Uncharacterized protein n=1 Tax=Catenulispora yoronensis TaxID=450799 RepID=A0ABN2TZN7_9ACTN
MAQGVERSADQVADAVDYVCRYVEQVRAVLAAEGSAGVLDVVISALQNGEDPRASLEDLHRALRVAGDALGIYGHARGLTPAGVDRYARPEAVFLCPRNEYPCARFAWPSSGVIPRCKISDEPLRRDTVG